MQKKTVYLAGKITGDPFYRSKFYEAQKKLEEGGFIVVNPALLPSERFPELALLYHVPNGGSRNKIEAARLRAQGVKSGVPDLCLPVARGGNHGLLEQGYAAAICKGWQEAASVIIDYLQRKTEG